MMNATIKMVKKDLLYLTTSIKSVVIVAFIFCVGMPFANLGMVVALPALIGYMLIYSVMAYEERSKVQLLNIALPITREEICRAKYLEGMIYILVGCILALIGAVLHLRLNSNSSPNHLVQILTKLFAVSLIVGSIYNGVILPFVFYFGVIKARYYLMASYVIIFIIANTLNSKEMLMKIPALMNQTSNIFPLLGIIIAACILYISYLISLNIWRKKDFK